MIRAFTRSAAAVPSKTWAAGLCLGLALSAWTLPQDAAAQTTVAGVTSGALSVDETGSAGYTIPIAVPPGIAGMQPSLALVYKSHGGNSTAGVGWSLSAASSIHRCGQTLVQDSAIHGVDFSADDRFCLDGQRLVAVSGTYGADGTEYRTEIDGFARIVSHGVAGTGPERFTVESKSGQTLDYGNTTDSRLGVPGQSEIRLWSLNRVTDTAGNAMTYHYVEDLADHSYRLDRIEYTRNDAQAVLPKSEVRFLYEARPDVRTSYRAGAEMAMTRRLAKIETYTDSGTGLALVKDVRLTYEISTATARSRLTAVTECDAGNNCLAPVGMGWQTGTSGFALSAPHELPSAIYNGSNKELGEFVDVNGDGLRDWVLAYSQKVNNVYVSYRTTYLSTGNGWTESPSFQLPSSIYLVGVTSGALSVGATGSAGSTIPVSIFPTSPPPDSGYKLGEFVDVNGDGLLDWVNAYGVFRTVYLNTPGGWVDSPDHYLPTAVYSNSYRKLGEFVDVDGDGLQDWVLAYSQKVNNVYVSYRTTYLSTGNGWVETPSLQLPSSIHNVEYGTKAGEFVDVNGDGLLDWVNAYGAFRTVYLNTSSGWVDSPDHYLPTAVYSSSRRKLGEFIDVNGDGLLDWVNAYGVFRTVYLNTPGGWVDSPDYYLPTAVYTSSFRKLGEFVDVNGNGLQDWVVAYPGNLDTYLSGYSNPDVLTSLTDSLGRVSTLDYAPLTDAAVYSKDSDAVFPVVDIQAPLYVVKSVSSDDGVGGQAVTSYSYAGAKVHVQGRGFRGFRQMTATDTQTGIVTTTDYDQVFPYTAQVTKSVKTLADGTRIKTIDNTWDSLSLNAGATVYPYVATSTSEDYETNDGLGNLPVVSRSATAVFDTYGNPTSLTTTTTGGGESFTETTVNTYANDTVNWFLGLVTRSEVTRSRGAP